MLGQGLGQVPLPDYLGMGYGLHGVKEGLIQEQLFEQPVQVVFPVQDGDESAAR